MDFNEIKNYFETNKESDEVKNFIGGFVNNDTVSSFLESEDGKKVLQPRLDKHFTKSLETWKQNSLNALVEAEVNKRNPAETPAEKQIRELSEKLINMEKATQMEKLKNIAIKSLGEKGLPISLADYFNADSEEGVNTFVTHIAGEWKTAVENSVNERLKGKTPPASTGGGDTTLTKEDLLKMPMKDRVKVFNEQPELWKKLMG